jgi:glycerol-3-phosphate dehydrogenase (NAD(P)+)
MEEPKKVAVIGGGSFATALVKILCNTQDKVYWWMRNADALEHIQMYGHNPNYLSSADLDVKKLYLSNDLEHVIDLADFIVLATPSAFLTSLFEGKDIKNLDKKIFVSTIKGIIPETQEIPADFIKRVFGVPYERIAMICGPCHAEEVAMEKLSYLTIACPNEETAKTFAAMMSCRYVNTSTSDDLFGTEISAILKNIYALAAGICHGLGYGDNFQSVLISNAVQETKRFIDAVHPITRDVSASAYLGDLLVTAYSQFSRNRVFGNMIGKGYSVRSAQLEMNMIAEGYYAVKSVHEINKKHQAEIPIVDAVYRILYEKVPPSLEMKLLTKKLN